MTGQPEVIFGVNLWKRQARRAHLRERNAKWNEGKDRGIATSFGEGPLNKCTAVTILSDSRENSGVCGRGVYNWRDRLDHSNPPAAPTRERILFIEILRLKRPKFLDMETSLTILAAATLTEFSSYGNFIGISTNPQVLGRPRKTKE
jgi:hypothetical protein